MVQSHLPDAHVYKVIYTAFLTLISEGQQKLRQTSTCAVNSHQSATIYHYIEQAGMKVRCARYLGYYSRTGHLLNSTSLCYLTENKIGNLTIASRR